MQIQLPSHIEQAILAAFNSGDFDRVADQLAEAVRRSGAAMALSPSSASDTRRRSWEEFASHKTPEAIAAEQGIKPIRDATALAFPDWPENETADAFIARAKGLEPDVCS